MIMLKTEKQLNTVLELQNKLNNIINSSWKDANFNWRRAAWVECAELQDHLCYKWWKNQTKNIPQAHIELVDIFFFLISDLLVKEHNLKEEDYAFKTLMQSLSSSPSSDLEIFTQAKDDLLCIDELALFILQQNEKTLSLFHAVCKKLGLSFDELYKMYICKNVLNIFRQSKGYKEGTYIKQWPSPLEPFKTVEDNVYLEMYLQESDTQKMFAEEPDFVFTYLYDKLCNDYPNV